MTERTQPAPRRESFSPQGDVTADKRAAVSLGLAIASLFFGLTVPIPVWGLFMLVPAAPLGIAALVYGHSALSMSRTSGSGRSKVVTALVMAYAGLAICLFTTLFWVITMATAR